MFTFVYRNLMIEFLLKIYYKIVTVCSLNLYLYHVLWQTADEKEELEPWLVKEMDELLSEIWLTGNEDCFSQLIHLIKSENVSGLTGYDNKTSMNIPYQSLIQKTFICIRY